MQDLQCVTLNRCKKDVSSHLKAQKIGPYEEIPQLTERLEEAIIWWNVAVKTQVDQEHRANAFGDDR